MALDLLPDIFADQFNMIFIQHYSQQNTTQIK